MLMKKFTLFLASVILSLGAIAQTPEKRLTADDLNAVTTKLPIAIKCTQESSYTTYHSVNGRTGDLSNDIIFYWVPVTEGVAGAYYITKGDGENDYLQKSNTKTFGTLADAAQFHAVKPSAAGQGVENFGGANVYEDEATGGAYYVRIAFTDNSMWFNFNGDTYNTGTGVWTVQNVYDMTGINYVKYKVVYNFKYEGEDIASQTTTVADGSAYPDFAVALPYGLTADKPAGNVTADATVEITLTKTSELPFEVAADAEHITTWYYVRYHTSANKLFYIEALADGKVEWADDKDVANTDAHLWGFVGDIWGLKVVSKTGKAITSLNDGFAMLGEVADATAFMAVASRVDGNVCLKYPNGGDFLNAQNGFLKSWWDNDQGSAFLVEEYVAPEGPTGVESVEAQQTTVIYDLAGRRVENPTKGIYIVNGKKVVIK